MIDRGRLASLINQERALFRRTHQRCEAAFGEASSSLLAGVPMPWMTQWPSPFPPFVRLANGSRLTDLDGNVYVDFCLGDTGAMAGHAPGELIEGIAAQGRLGLTTMMPTPDAVRVGSELALRFGLPFWHFALSATDANRFAIRLARHLTGRSKIVVYNWCYHGSVDETLAVTNHGGVTARPESIGAPVPLSATTRVVEWNDVAGLENALADGQVACVLAEPAMTNIGIVKPRDGYHAELRRLTRKFGTYLILDETHTICCGPGGYTGEHNLSPDFLTIGKAIAGGVPMAAYGMSQQVVDRIGDGMFLRASDVGGIGGTLAGNALSFAAARVVLERVLTPEAFSHMAALAEIFERDVGAVIHKHGLPWHVTRLGCRVEYWFCERPPSSGAEAAAAADPLLDHYLHLYLMNRGVAMTPFHNMALMSPATSEEDVALHSQLFARAVAELVAHANDDELGNNVGLARQ